MTSRRTSSTSSLLSPCLRFNSWDPRTPYPIPSQPSHLMPCRRAPSSYTQARSPAITPPHLKPTSLPFLSPCSGLPAPVPAKLVPPLPPLIWLLEMETPLPRSTSSYCGGCDWRSCWSWAQSLRYSLWVSSELRRSSRMESRRARHFFENHDVGRGVVNLCCCVWISDAAQGLAKETGTRELGQ